MSADYVIDDTIELTYTCENRSGTAVRPSALSFFVRTPAGVETEYTYVAGQITEESTGTYYMALTVDEAGIWECRAEATSPSRVLESSFTVRAASF